MKKKYRRSVNPYNYFTLAASARNCLLISVLAFWAEATTSALFCVVNDVNYHVLKGAASHFIANACITVM